jgi:hypothetical protein
MLCQIIIIHNIRLTGDLRFGDGDVRIGSSPYNSLNLLGDKSDVLRCRGNLVGVVGYIRGCSIPALIKSYDIFAHHRR